MSQYSIILPAYQNRLRYDYIQGVKTGPFIDGSYVQYRQGKGWTPLNTPQFGKYLQNKWRKPVNKYELWKERSYMPHGANHLTVYWVPTGDYSEYYGPSSAGFGEITYLQPSAAEKTQLFNDAVTGALQKIKSQKVHLGNLAAQRKQVLDMFADTAERCARAMRNLRRGRFKEAFKALQCRPTNNVSHSKSAASNWLALQYGWLPLYSDLYGATEELERSYDRTKAHPPLISVVAQRRWHKSRIQDGVASIGAVGSCETIYDARVKFTYTVDVASAQWLGRVGLTNPLDIAWEVLPYSFVVDWIYPIGKFINTLDATLGCTFVDGSNSGTMRCNLHYTRNADYTIGNYRYVWHNCTGDTYYFTYDRDKYTGFPTVQLPHFKNPFSAQHYANALALLVGAFPKR